MQYLNKLIPAALLLVAVYSCGPEKKPENTRPAVPESQAKVPKATPDIAYTVVTKYPHDVSMFTEGLLFHDGKLFESSGDVEYLPQTRSVFGYINQETGKVDVKGELNREKYFGEGTVFVKGKLYQVTYQNRTGFIYDAKTFKNMGQFGYQNEGWGLTTEGKNIIMSDGTNYLTYLDPKDFHIVKVLGVTENGYAVDYLNELELIKGYIYANVWMKNEIVKIDTASGEVVGKLKLDALTEEAKKENAGSLEMNGIAYDSITDKILVTGKMWPSLYEIKFSH